MTEKQKTFVDVLEELVYVTESLCADIADIVPFNGKYVMFQNAVDLHQHLQRVILSNKCIGIKFGEGARALRDEDNLPF